MSAGDVLHWRGLTLLPERAVWQEATRTLWIADLHLGKDLAFRRAGQPVPDGTTDADLARLAALMDRLDAARLVVLGDFLHAAAARSPALFDRLRRWRTARRAQTCLVVRGNHDAHAGDAPPDCGVESVDEPFDLDGVAGRHHPLTQAERAQDGPTVLAGHIHPVARIAGPGRDRLRLPCFCLEGRQIILPSFGGFTGGCLVEPEAGRDLCLTTGTKLFVLAAGRTRGVR